MRALRSLPVRAAAALVSASLFLSACGGDEEPQSAPEEPAESQATEAAEEPQVWPLTGLPAQGDAAEKDHPVMVIKMDNTAGAAPQVGLGSADLVVEEVVEGGVTRLAAFYYRKLPKEVGPVRSMRASDIGIVAPVDGTVVTSGAAGVTIDRIRGAGIPFYEEGAKGFYRNSSRSAPYNLFTNLRETAEAATLKQPQRPADYLPWGGARAMRTGKPATTISASFGRHVTNWRFRNGTYVNENTFAADGDAFPAKNVLVLRVKTVDAGYADPAGNFVPETKFEGTGEALLFSGGKVVEGKWSKKKLGSPLRLTRADGKAMWVPPGKTWIELVPQAGKVDYGR